MVGIPARSTNHILSFGSMVDQLETIHRFVLTRTNVVWPNRTAKHRFTRCEDSTTSRGRPMPHQQRRWLKLTKHCWQIVATTRRSLRTEEDEQLWWCGLPSTGMPKRRYRFSGLIAVVTIRSLIHRLWIHVAIDSRCWLWRSLYPLQPRQRLKRCER